MTFSDDRPFANKILKKYKPAIPFKKIKNLSDTEMFNNLGNAMFYDDEEGL